MRILLIGKNGQLGWELQRTLFTLGEVVCLDYPEIDLAHPETVCERIGGLRPAVVVNAAAYTQVDRAESEPQLALAINARSPGCMAQAAAEVGAAFIHYSTDYVFDGTKGSPYIEDDEPCPVSVYGASKLAGEQAVAQSGAVFLTLRTSWVYSTRRESFVSKILAWATKQPSLRVVTDQIGNPTWARALAEVTAPLLALGHLDPAAWMRPYAGVYHLAGDGAASRLEWAQAILRNDPTPEQRACRELLPALTAEFPAPAARPLHSALNCAKFADTFGLRLPPWQEALYLAMQEIK
jgi:dTDP-4-dehydrorhamnose reductase